MIPRKLLLLSPGKDHSPLAQCLQLRHILAHLQQSLEHGGNTDKGALREVILALDLFHGQVVSGLAKLEKSHPRDLQRCSLHPPRPNHHHYQLLILARQAPLKSLSPTLPSSPTVSLPKNLHPPPFLARLALRRKTPQLYPSQFPFTQRPRLTDHNHIQWVNSTATQVRRQPTQVAPQSSLVVADSYIITRVYNTVLLGHRC
jgi:hypothetical protein